MCYVIYITTSKGVYRHTIDDLVPAMRMYRALRVLGACVSMHPEIKR